MIDNYLLEGLVAFAKAGTLAKAAAQLSVTQPALTRSMKKIEDELGVPLFNRQPNRISLNETGKFAAAEAQKLLWTNQAYGIKVQNFAQSHAKIKLAADAPGPLIIARAVKAPNVLIHDAFIKDRFADLLKSGQFSLLLLNHCLSGEDFSSTYLGTESLAINVPADSPFAKVDQLSFTDMKGTTFLVGKNVGFWDQLFEDEIPNGRFIYQDDSAEYSELLAHSSFPFFSTNLTVLDKLWGADLPKNRVTVPFTDPVAHQQFYANYLATDRQRLTPLIGKLQDVWATVD